MNESEREHSEELDGDLAVIEQLEREEYGPLAEAMSLFDQSSSELLDQMSGLSIEGYDSEDLKAIGVTVLSMAHAFRQISTAIFASEPDAEKAAAQIVDIFIDNEKSRIELFLKLRSGVNYVLCDKELTTGQYVDACQDVDPEKYPEIAQGFLMQNVQADINTLLHNLDEKEPEDVEQRRAKVRPLAIEIGKMAAAAVLALGIAAAFRGRRSR